MPAIPKKNNSGTWAVNNTITIYSWSEMYTIYTKINKAVTISENFKKN